MTEEVRVPVYAAYAVPASIARLPQFAALAAVSWLVPCPACGRIHIHGKGEGMRSAHCPPNTPTYAHEFEGRTPPNSYILEYAGEAPLGVIEYLKPKRARR